MGNGTQATNGPILEIPHVVALPLPAPPSPAVDDSAPVAPTRVPRRRRAARDRSAAPNAQSETLSIDLPVPVLRKVRAAPGRSQPNRHESDVYVGVGRDLSG